VIDPIDRLKTALVGRYRIERELGAGAMATVYLAEDLKHHRRVALKVLRPELAVALDADRFLREIEVTAGLQHPHILPLFDSGEADGLLFYVMPFVAGKSLRDRLLREGRLPLGDAVGIARDVAAALTVAHAHGIVHRDIKPENILLEDGEALVADFGIALARASVGEARLTASGLSVGTPIYMSPEQILGEKSIDGRSDVYALGGVLFEMLTGEPPFTGSTAQAILGQNLTAAPPSARVRRGDVPQEVDAAIRRAMAKDPAERFATPRELAEACAIPVRGRPSRRWVVAASLAVVALATAVAYPLWQSARAERARSLLPTITALATEGRYVEAYALARSAERRLGTDTALARIFDTVADQLTVTTDPPGADVHIQRVPEDGDVDSDSVHLGRTPIVRVRLPRADYRVVVRRDGYAPHERMVSSALARMETGSSGRRVELALALQPADSVPPDMVAVPGGRYRMVSPDLPIGLEAGLQPFFLDRFEVTNEQFADFVRSGGYRAREWWVSDESAGVRIGGFVDRTGLPGPRDWVNQAPASGTERHPVTGVSWHESAAYCAYRGKRLPTLFEWEKAARDGQFTQRGVNMPWGAQTAATRTEHRANFGGSGPAPVDAFPFGISPFGVYAMAGNVKEWLANPVTGGFAVAGGSWQDPAYLFSEVGAVADTAATAGIGLRCARIASGTSTSGDQGGGRVQIVPTTPEYRSVDPATFRTLLTHYRYDRRPANARIVERVETGDWTRERIWFDGVGNDSVLAYLYLPSRAQKPFQTIVYVASSAAFFFEPVWQATEHDVGPMIRAGRAVLAVVLKGMLERPFPTGSSMPPPPSVGFRDLMVQHATEMRLGMDYLETRDDIDAERLAYQGLSLGAGSRLTLAAVDDRFKSVVLVGAGIDERMHPTLPEAANFNFAPYIRPPKLLLNGRNDEEHPWLTRAKPLWDLLREPKELVLIDGAGHHPPVEERVRPINAFLDRTLGPVDGERVPE
jgi:formylglycine-generating enzyme required for sulfatase activity/tRNA A-37 threonylcarbamoyl transferase component Bud32/pimeloyl-ACP methyl ester carboxylesterase